MAGTDVLLRPLEKRDASGMLEWMHDPDINQYFRFDAGNMTADKAEEFIENSVKEAKERKSFHFAIADKNDEYLGTISLKNIDWDAKAAEYAVCLRNSAQGTGAAYAATQKLLEIAFEGLHLRRVFLNVLPENKRAIHLYEKCGFVYEGEFRKHLFLKGEVRNLKWYSILKEEYKCGICNSARGGVINPYTFCLLPLLTEWKARNAEVA